MKKIADVPVFEWFTSLAAITDALNVLENQCTSVGFESVADRIHTAKVSIAAAADIIQDQAYDELAVADSSEDGSSTAKH
jgi:hypothetical protein